MVQVINILYDKLKGLSTLRTAEVKIFPLQ